MFATNRPFGQIGSQSCKNEIAILTLVCRIGFHQTLLVRVTKRNYVVIYKSELKKMSYFSLQALVLDLQWLINLGPRPYQSEASQLASIGIQERMVQAGWDMKTINLKGNLIGCKGKGSTLFLAHHDTVPDSPGAIDNAVGVAALLELARNTQATDLCIGFPTAEEIGLIGSTQMVSFIHKWHPSPEELRLVVSLELVGQGSLWVSGLSKNWDSTALSQLTEQPYLQYEYAYQVVSRILPSMERSDHRPFADEGFRSMMIVGRDKNGIFPKYHSVHDTTFDEQAIPPLLETLESIAKTPFPPMEDSPSSLIVGRTNLPSWLIWCINILGIVLGIKESRRFIPSMVTMLKSTVPMLVAGGSGFILATQGLFSTAPQEQTAAQTLGIPPSGWWAAAPWCTLFFILSFFILKRFNTSKASASLLCSALSIPMLIIDPFLAFPMALASIGAYFWSPLALLGAIYWIQPRILRELSFHGLLPPYLWFGLCILLIPILGHSHARNRNPD